MNTVSWITSVPYAQMNEKAPFIQMGKGKLSQSPPFYYKRTPDVATTKKGKEGGEEAKATTVVSSSAFYGS